MATRKAYDPADVLKRVKIRRKAEAARDQSSPPPAPKPDQKPTPTR